MILILLSQAACLEQANDLSELDQGLDDLDREITISGPSEVMPGGLYEYTLFDSCFFIVPTCSYQDYTVTDLWVTGTANVSVPSDPYNDNHYRLQTTGEGVATVHIKVLDNNNNIRVVETEVKSYYPNRVVLECCRSQSGDTQSVKIPVGDTGTLPIAYYKDTISLRAPDNYTGGINIPPEITVQSVAHSFYQQDLIEILTPSAKTRLTLTSDYDSDFMAEVHVYDVYDVDEVVIYTVETSTTSTRITPRVKIEGIEPRTRLDFDYLYEIQTQDICQFGSSVFEVEGAEFTSVYRIAGGTCVVKVSLLGEVISRNPLVVDPRFDPAAAINNTVEIQFN